MTEVKTNMRLETKEENGWMKKEEEREIEEGETDILTLK